MAIHIIKTLLIGIFSLLLIGGIVFRILYWQHQLRYPSSATAFIEASTVPITSQISGTITTVYVHDHELVKRGDLLFQIDPTPYKLAVNQLQANLHQARTEVKAQQKAVIAAEKLVEERQQQLSDASKVAYQIGNSETNEQVKAAGAGLEDALQLLDQTLSNYGKPGTAKKRIKYFEVALSMAEQGLQYTYTTAPTNGYINHLNVAVGAKIQAQQKLFDLVENNEWWVKANFKPGALKRIQPNQLAIIKFSLYPNYSLSGVVESINANQVKIKILNPNPNFPLNIGTGSTVIVDTGKS